MLTYSVTTSYKLKTNVEYYINDSNDLSKYILQHKLRKKQSFIVLNMHNTQFDMC